MSNLTETGQFMRLKSCLTLLAGMLILGWPLHSAQSADVSTSVSEHKIYPSNEQNWWVMSSQLVVENAIVDAEFEVAAGNCRLVAIQSFGLIILAGGDESYIAPKFGMIIVADTSDLITDGVRAAIDRATAYGVPYNRTVRRLCEF